MINYKDQVVILAGGYARRLGKLTKNVPKSLLMFNKLPFIDYQIKYFKKQGINKFLILSGYLNKKIKNYFQKKKNQNIEINFSNDGKKKLGTGGAIKKAYPYLNQNFFLIYGDTYPSISLYKLKKKHLMKKSLYTMSILKNKNKYDKSNIILKDNKIFKYDKKLNNAEYIDYGVSMINKKIFKKEKAKAFDLKILINKLINFNNMNYFIVKKRFYEIGSKKGIKDFKKYLTI